MSSRRMAGVTLVELIVAIVIIGAALAGLTAAFARANLASADPVITQQMLAIGEGMMEEVLLKPFKEDATPAPSRAQFNDVRDYDVVDDASPGYASSGIRDIEGEPIAGLEDYGVSVRVESSGVLLTGVPAGNALRVTVTVSHGERRLALTGWRTSPWEAP